MSDSSAGSDAIFEGIKWDGQGLIPVVVQDEKGGDVVMVAYMNKEALALTQETKRAHYYLSLIHI